MNKFKKIEQFRNVIREVQQKARFQGLDENDEPIYAAVAEMPVIEFTGTPKIHGTNAAIGLDKEGKFFCQSRNNIITPENDNLAFAYYAYENESILRAVLQSLGDYNEHVIIYGEWAGQGIQKGVGISGVERSFFMFRAKVDGSWIKDLPVGNADINVYNIPRMQQYKMLIDFNNPQMSQNALITLTEAVEAECPIAKHLGVSGIGEGIVWANDDYSLVFKVKGTKHSVTKVKKLAEVDIEKLKTINDFIEYAVTENRMEQGIQEVTPDIDIKKMGDFIRWVHNDVVAEESDTMMENGLERKDIGKPLADKCRKYFMGLQI